MKRKLLPVPVDYGKINPELFAAERQAVSRATISVVGRQQDIVVCVTGRNDEDEDSVASTTLDDIDVERLRDALTHWLETKKTMGVR